MNSNDESYFCYLKQRSTLGEIYRQFFLYPRIKKHVHGNLLDFGCGIGDFLKFYPRAVGVDVNKYNVNYCKSQGLFAKLIKDGAIPYPKNVFDSIVMDNVLEHINEREVHNVLREVLRVLRPGGVLLTGVPGIKGFQLDSDHKVFYTECELAELLSVHGFKMVKSFNMPLPWGFMSRFLSQHCTYAVFKIGKI